MKYDRQLNLLLGAGGILIVVYALSQTLWTPVPAPAEWEFPATERAAPASPTMGSRGVAGPGAGISPRSFEQKQGPEREANRSSSPLQERGVARRPQPSETTLRNSPAAQPAGQPTRGTELSGAAGNRGPAGGTLGQVAPQSGAPIPGGQAQPSVATSEKRNPQDDPTPPPVRSSLSEQRPPR